MHILITAGPTREPLDPVRFISNRSSGKMGYALARAALSHNHSIRLIAGPVQLPPPPGAQVLGVETADDMLQAVRQNLDWCDVLIMAAAVADWRPAACSSHKLKKSEMAAHLTLEKTRDILQTVRPAKGTRLFVGFAAETGDPVPEARRKLAEKGLDLVVANDVTSPGAGFEVDTNRVTLIAADGTVTPLPLMSKDEVAKRIIAWVEQTRGYSAKPRNP